MTLAISIVVTLFGAILVALGWRGRHFETTPRCRRCGYDLRGIDSPTRCPECGASLDVPKAIRREAVQHRPSWIIVGSAILLLGGAMIGLDRGGWLSVARLKYLSPTSVELFRTHYGPAGAGRCATANRTTSAASYCRAASTRSARRGSRTSATATACRAMPRPVSASARTFFASNSPTRSTTASIRRVALSKAERERLSFDSIYCRP